MYIYVYIYNMNTYIHTYLNISSSAPFIMWHAAYAECSLHTSNAVFLKCGMQASYVKCALPYME